jgi:hypothetical protein
MFRKESVIQFKVIGFRLNPKIPCIFRQHHAIFDNWKNYFIKKSNVESQDYNIQTSKFSFCGIYL